MKKKKLFLVLFPLILGVAIYLLYRSRTLFYFKIFETHPKIYDYVIKIRDAAWLYRKHLPLWLVYSLPDGLWLFSFGASMLINRFYYALHLGIFTLIYLFMIALEFVQKHFGGYGTTLGTYDKYDILCYSCAYVLVVIISLILHRRCVNKFRVKLKKKEFVEDLRYILIFTILGVLPSLF